MEPKQRKKGRLIRALFWLSGAGLVLLVFLPVWFPWVLPAVAKQFGLRFAGYERLGWSRFAVTGVQGDWDGTRLEVQRVEAALPTTWFWRPLFSVSDGQLVIAGANTNPVSEPGSTGATLNQVARIGALLQRWLPAAELANCIIEVVTQPISIPHALWRDGQLQATVRDPRLRGEIVLTIRAGEDLPLELAVEWAEFATTLGGEFTRSLAGWRWAGELTWRANRADLTAQFTTNAWWPAQAQVICRNWQIPAGVDGYDKVTASLSANLVSNRFDVQATGLAPPARSGWPEVNFSLGATGDPTGVQLHTLNIQSPWLNANLTNTVGITWAGELLAEPAQLQVAVDLAKLPGTTLTGLAHGSVRIEPPVAQFQFVAEQVQAGPVAAESILVRGEYAAKILTLTEVRADFADGSKLTATGELAGQNVTARWQLAGDLVQKLVPGLCYAGLAAAGELGGSLTNLTHHGEVTVTGLEVAGLKPVDGRVTWIGQQKTLTTVESEWTAGESVLSMAGAAEVGVVMLHQLALRRGAVELYALQQPSVITFGAGGIVAVDGFDWRTDGRALAGSADIAWPTRGAATVTMTNVAVADFADFLDIDIPPIVIAELAASAQWSNGPVRSVISVAGSLRNRGDQVFRLRGAVTTDEFLTIDLTALAGGSTLVMTGTVPVQVLAERLVWNETQAIALTGNWQNGRPEDFAIPLGRWGELTVSQPALRFAVSGTPAAPFASLTAGAAGLDWQALTNAVPHPKLTDLQLAVEIRPDVIQLKTFTAQVDGQPIRAVGEWPLPAGAWRTGQWPDWSTARGELEVADAQVAALAAYLPALLAPEGRLGLAVALEPGKHLTGVLTLTNAATRSIGTISPLRDIAAVVRFTGTRAELEDFQAQIGGQPVHATGFVTMAGTGAEYQVSITGTNVPVVRSSELLLRADVAVTLSGGSNQPPDVAGAIQLRDGLFVQNATALVWSSPRRPEMRPPYFSVTNAPFADWKLDLAVRGDRFLRLRTPVFSGIASADLRLKGTLRAPILTGDARVNSGRLIFPFGALTVNQGLVSFSGNDPQGPDIHFNAGGRNYRYDLRLEVKGPADGANVTFTSTPPLASEQILLILTAGELPQSEFAFSNTARAGRLATFLGQDLLGRFLGTDPAKERLTIRTGEGISAEGRLTYSVEYRLNERWSIIGEYDEFNAFNADLKWKVFTR